MNKLVAASFVGGVAVYGMSILYINQCESKLKSSPIYIEALEAVKTHEGARWLLGEPIKDTNLGRSGSFLPVDGLFEFSVNLQGSKKHGKLFVTALGNTFYTLRLDTIQLQLENDKSRRLIVKEPTPRLLETTNEMDTIYL